MADPVTMPAMGEAQKQSWQALMDLYERVNAGWTLIGGQLVHLHCAERGASPARPTNDIDTVVDIPGLPDDAGDLHRGSEGHGLHPGNIR